MKIELGLPENFGIAMRRAVSILENPMSSESYWRNRCVAEQEAVRRLYEAQERVRINDDCPPMPEEYAKKDLWDMWDEQLYVAVITMFDGVEPPITYGPIL